MLKETLAPTPNDCALPRRRADFATFSEAIDYAARSEKGLNFHDMRGTLERLGLEHFDRAYQGQHSVQVR